MKWVEHNGHAVNIELCKSISKVESDDVNSIILGFDCFIFDSKENADIAYDKIIKFIRDNVKGVLYV